eukprot:TRINITY_DN132_c0_g1_i1.p1 TRINITY_DN132_c0_g1~~TRINITY_DN132_c0_g1_i1.p1  ORF type:complete len:293 (+),score=38.61 TRINITY_DN132_c0_g1_i1:50-928(+)
MAARGIIIIAMLASSQLTPVTGYSSGAGSAACGFDPDSGRPGGPGNTSHGTLRNGNGGFGLVLQRSGQERDFILLNGVAGFVGFLIQTKQAGVTLASNAPNIQRGPCSHESLTHSQSDTKSYISFMATRSPGVSAEDVNYRVTVLINYGASYYIFNATAQPSSSTSTTTMTMPTAPAELPTMAMNKSSTSTATNANTTSTVTTGDTTTLTTADSTVPSTATSTTATYTTTITVTTVAVNRTTMATNATTTVAATSTAENETTADVGNNGGSFGIVNAVLELVFVLVVGVMVW